MLKSGEKMKDERRGGGTNEAYVRREGGREGGRRVTVMSVGGVTDCFPYFKRGPLDRSAYKTTGGSNLCGSVPTEPGEGWRTFPQISLRGPVYLFPFPFFSIFVFISHLTLSISSYFSTFQGVYLFGFFF